jgi:hypothetical protein
VYTGRRVKLLSLGLTLDESVLLHLPMATTSDADDEQILLSTELS